MSESSFNLRSAMRWRSLLLIATAAVAGAIHVGDGAPCAPALGALTIAIVCALAGIVLMRTAHRETPGAGTESLALRAILVVQFILLFTANPAAGFLRTSDGVPWVLLSAAAVAAVAALWSTAAGPRAGAAAFGVVLACYLVAGIWFLQHTNWPSIDVLMFQQESATALLDGSNPYSLRFRDPYSPEISSFVYSPGVSVNGWLTIGFPYPPLSLFLVAPARLLSDVRYAHLLAMTVAAGLIGWARPSKWSYGVAAMFLFTPRVFLVLGCSWTEPLVVLMLAAVVFCACRWPRAVPWMFGLFLAVKQYLVLAVPLAVLLLRGEFRWKELRGFLSRSFAIALVVTLPLALWDFSDYIRSAVLWLLNQPFRPDGLSYLAWMFPTHSPPAAVSLGVPLVTALAGLALVLRCCPRNPAGFALATAIVFLLFFSFNRQGLINYYYFVIGALCCGLAVAPPPASTDSTAANAQP